MNHILQCNQLVLLLFLRTLHKIKVSEASAAAASVCFALISKLYKEEGSVCVEGLASQVFL